MLIMPFREICTTAIRSARPRTTPFIKKFPVTLRFQYPSWETPALLEFSSAQDITDFLSTPKQFLYEPLTGKAIRPNQVDRIDPDLTHEVAGSGLPYREKGLSRDQVWDRDFEMKTELALKDMLEKKDLKVTELPRVIKGRTGKDISEWQAVYQLSDGGVVFLETKFRMSKVGIQVPPITRPTCIRITLMCNQNASRKASRLWERVLVHNYTWPHFIGRTMKTVYRTLVIRGMASYSPMGQT